MSNVFETNKPGSYTTLLNNGSDDDRHRPNGHSNSTHVSTQKRKTSWLTRVKALLFGLIFALVLAELTLRAIGYSSPAFSGPSEIYGTGYRPGVRGWYRTEGYAWNEINSYGWRDKEWQIEKPADIYRIAFIGDSYTSAQQIDLDKTFVSLITKNLNSDNSAAAQVKKKFFESLNFGCNGFGTTQELLSWEYSAKKFKPDLVVLCVFLGNDISDNHPELEIRNRPYHHLKDGMLELDNSFRNSEYFISHTQGWKRSLYSAMDYSRLFQLVYTYKLRSSVNEYIVREKNDTPSLSIEKQKLEADKKNSPLEEPGIMDAIYYEKPVNKKWEEAWQVTEALVAQLRDEVESTGAKFVVVTMSNSVQVTPNEKRRNEYMRQHNLTDLFAPDRKLEAICERHHIRHLILAPELYQVAQKEHKSLHGFAAFPDMGHWNEYGHRVVSELMTDWLKKQIAQ